MSDPHQLTLVVNAYLPSNLDSDDKIKMKAKILQSFKVATSIAIPPPMTNETKQQYIKVENYWLECGNLLPKADENYALTKTVKENLADIARIVCSGRFPILLEGETSVGKTAIVTYLGKITENEVIRINNHEHTDIQEYMVSYVAGDEGRLVFAEGALVKAVRNGSWVILDELNLAPTDVIESLNRLLDDNRELFIPELNTTIKAHPRFRLFATQNPAGTYSGRKRLSRALLSRFVVLKFNHLPMDELVGMVHIRCKVPPTAAQNMITVLMDLRSKRSSSGLFSARDGLMTLRDVFRCAKRLAMDPQVDWHQVLVDHGYFLLAGRCRNHKDELTVIEILEKALKHKINKDALFSNDSQYFPKNIDISKITLTYGMRRMLVLTEQAWKQYEGVKIFDERGLGKIRKAMSGKGSGSSFSFKKSSNDMKKRNDELEKKIKKYEETGKKFDKVQSRFAESESRGQTKNIFTFCLECKLWITGKRLHLACNCDVRIHQIGGEVKSRKGKRTSAAGPMLPIKDSHIISNFNIDGRDYPDRAPFKSCTTDQYDEIEVTFTESIHTDGALHVFNQVRGSDAYLTPQIQI